MADEPTKKSALTNSETEVDYALLDQLVEDNPALTDEQLLQLYQQHIKQPQSTVALISDDLNQATKVILASALPDPQAPKNTQSQAQYRIDHKIDSGGQSHVYLAHRDDGTYQKTVVIKVLNQSIEGETQKQQMMAEMQILADLKHPNIVSILDAGIDEQKRPWLMLDFIPGVHIDQFMHQHALHQNQVMSLFISLAKALQYIHQKQVVHADIKPANILVEMLNKQPRAVIIDFGIATTDDAKHPNSPYIFATPAFASPEQLNAQPGQVDHRSDIFSFGQVMQHLLDIQTQVHQSTSWVTQDLTAIIAHCLANNPEHRYPDMQDLIADLDRFQQGDVVSVVKAGVGQLLSRKVKRYKWQSAVLLVIISFTVFLINNSVQQNNQNQALLKGAASSQQYWQSADDISNQSRLIYALPKRNIKPDFKALNLKFDSLLEQVATEPPAIQNLAFTSMADAGISLGRFDAAQALLLKAHAVFPDNPEVKFKLAKNYLILYQNEVQTLEKFSSAAQRKEQRQRLQNKYFIPALELLEKTEGAELENPLISSLLYYFQGNHEQALQQLASSDSELLWPIERLLLTAQISREQANQLLLSSAADSAMPLLTQSYNQLNQAKQIARSHPEVYRQLCQTESLLLQLQKQSKQTTISNCDEYLTVLPDTAEAILVAADAYAQLAKSWLDQGQSPAQLLAKSRSILDHPWLNETTSNQAQAEQLKGHLLSTEGKWHLYSNQQFTSFFEQAVQHHQLAVESMPNNYASQLALATAWYNLANNSRYSGNQTDTYFNQATELLTDLVQHADSTQFLPGFLVRVYTDHAYIRYQHGLPADQQLTQAELLVRHTMSASPDNHFAQLATATLYWTFSDYLVLQDKNPQPYLDQAIEAFDQVIANQPAQWTNQYNQISAMLSGVTYYLAQSTTQSTPLKAIKDKLDRLESSVSSDINLDSHWGYYHNMMALNDWLLKQNPQGNLSAAWQRNDSCSQSPIDGYVCYAQMATSLVTETQWNIEHPEQPIKLHKAYIEKIQLAIKDHPKHHRLYALYGQYLWLQSQHQSIKPKQKTVYLNQAQRHLEIATAGNQLLAEKYADDIKAIAADIKLFENLSH